MFNVSPGSHRARRRRRRRARGSARSRSPGDARPSRGGRPGLRPFARRRRRRRLARWVAARAPLQDVADRKRALLVDRVGDVGVGERRARDRHRRLAFDQRHLGGAARPRRAGPEPLHDRVDHALRHATIGRQLAAGDRQQAIRLDQDLVAARDLGRLLALLMQQRPHAGPRAAHVLVDDARSRPGAVGRFEKVVDVGAGDLRTLDRAREVGVGGADPDDVAERHDEDHAPVGRAHDDDVVDPQALARHHQMDTLGQVHARRDVAAKPAHRVDPRSGGVHDDPCRHLVAASRELVVQLDAEAWCARC